MATLGLDIGGANIKASWPKQSGSKRFALYHHPRKLGAALRETMATGPDFDRLAVTMTGELCDCFRNRSEGVRHIVSVVAKLAGRKPVRIWTKRGEFVDATQALDDPEPVASANWHAEATWVAQRCGRGRVLLMDVGSTTTDLIHIEEQQVKPRGLTDSERLATGELLYQGAWRTPLMALGPNVMWRGQSYGVMAEWFATMADVAVLVGQVAENESDRDTPDGQPLTCEAASRRVLRMVGADEDDADDEEATELAYAFHDMAVKRMVAMIEPGWSERAIVCGSGAWLADRALARTMLGDPILDLGDVLGAEVSTAACAMAVRELAEQEAGEATTGPARLEEGN